MKSIRIATGINCLSAAFTAFAGSGGARELQPGDDHGGHDDVQATLIVRGHDALTPRHLRSLRESQPGDDWGGYGSDD